MSDVNDGRDDVVGLITERIEARFSIRMEQLKGAVAAAPTAHPDATVLVRWHGLLVDAQEVLDHAESDLLAVLETQPSEVDDPTTDLAQRVNAAVRVRDGRAMIVGWLLELVTPALAGELMARFNRAARNGPAVQTSPARRPAVPPTPSRAPSAGRTGL
ncbi:hypothetical protein [Streptomyces sp. NPDC046860]|uniref:hypothetical protein n=1 Tax=Streptomyces sp. NPDC046860 TaxID=3154495 RepID=UPI0033DE04E5